MSTESSVRERTSVREKKPAEVPNDKTKVKEPSPPPEWNQLALCATNDAPLGILRPIMIVLEISCHGLLWIVATITMLMCIHKANHVEIVFNLFFGLIFDILLVCLIKWLVQRQRPSANYMDMVATSKVDQYSFPSGHATRACYLAIFIAKQVPDTRKLIVFTYTWAAFVCFSRLLLGRHHFTDVLCGCIIGVLEFYVLEMLWISQSTCSFILSPLLGELV
ncbi:phospholipid phosphatase 6 isoform X1 [Octopus sinensis]|uniref:Phospholipid phosphatase 6 isoform X1 n=1 Tax=Octopus sinensis TaxID=2607531 RepID=A0A6P7SQ13_9MOLL|nr:phospholipid phosphatase 6 isoform X2 [Octopus sinensis]XP_029639977.1 phospholipid phosphatase 6 isoform X1 [Octopus sinensis]